MRKGKTKYYKQIDDNFFVWNGWRKKGVTCDINMRLFSENLTIANLWHAVSRIWICKSSEFKFCLRNLWNDDTLQRHEIIITYNNDFSKATEYNLAYLSTIEIWVAGLYPAFFLYITFCNKQFITYKNSSN